MQASKRAPKLTCRRQGVTVVEAAIVMVIVIAAVVIVLGGLSAQTSNVFARASAAFGGGVDSPSRAATSKDEKTAEIAPDNENVAFVLIRFGVFAAVVFAFMAYTTFFVSKAETGDPEEVKKRKTKRKSDSRNPLVDLLLDRRSQIGRAIRDHTADFDSAKLTVEMFMTKKPITACVEDKLSDVMTVMRNRGFRHMMILDVEQKIAGIISDRDLVNTEGKQISEIMTPDPFTVEATTPISIAITLLVKNRISALPVLNETEVVGVLTRSDLLVTLQCLMLNIQEHLSESRLEPEPDSEESKPRDPRDVIVTKS